jgi:hypothetical protein
VFRSVRAADVVFSCPELRKILNRHDEQGPIHVTLPSDSSRSDVMQKLDNGDRVPVRAFRLFACVNCVCANDPE